MNSVPLYLPIETFLEQLHTNNRLRTVFSFFMGAFALFLHGLRRQLLWPLLPILGLYLSAWIFDKFYQRYAQQSERYHRHLRHAALTQSGLDLFLLAISMHFTGGVFSPLPLLFIIYLGSMAALFSPRYILLMSAVVLTFYWSMAGLYTHGWIAPYAMQWQPEGKFNSAFWVYQVALFSAAIFFNGILTSIHARQAYRRWQETLSNEVFLEKIRHLTRLSLQQSESGDLYKTIAEQAQHLLGADCIYLTRLDEESGEVFSLAASGLIHYRYAAQPPSTRGEKVFTRALLKANGPLVAQNVLCSPYVSARVSSAYPERSALAIPLTGFPSRRLLGAMLVTFQQPYYDFSPQMVSRAMQVGELMSLLISRLQLNRETQRRAELLEKFAAQVTELTSDLQQTTLLPAIVESARSLLGAQRAALHLAESPGGQLECQYAAGLSAKYLQQMTRRFNQTAIAQALQTKGLVLIPDVKQDSRTSPIQDIIALEKFQAYALFSLHTVSGQLGMLSLYWDTPRAISAEEVEVARLFAQRAASLLYHARLYARMSEEALTDVLTGLANRRALDLRLQEETLRLPSASFGLLMIDLDGFKGVNDSFGHAIGDSVLQQVADIFRGAIRASDTVFRFGGDEFSVILPGADMQQAVHVAQKLGNALASSGLHLPNDTQRYLTACIGVAACPQDGRDPQKMLSAADDRMYRAKRKGGAAIIFNEEA